MNPDDVVGEIDLDTGEPPIEIQYGDISPEFRAKFEEMKRRNLNIGKLTNALEDALERQMAMEAVVEAAREAKKFLGMDRPIDPSDILIDALAALDALEDA